MPEPTKTKAYVVECRTGCSCCASENHYRGPFKTKEKAEERARGYFDARLLASQFASHGVYHVSEVDCEVLPDGRLIIDGTHVVAGFADDNATDERMYDYS